MTPNARGLMTSPFSIAHYHVTAKIGAGGMGEVWRATDTKLARDVAIKILPDAFARDPDRLARFSREAQGSQNAPCAHPPPEVRDYTPLNLRSLPRGLSVLMRLQNSTS